MDSYSIERLKQPSYEEIMNELMLDYGLDISKLVMQYVHNQAIAEDLTQEIFIKCYKSLPKFKGNCSYKTWLWRIAINHSKDYLKSWHANHIAAVQDEFFVNVTSSQQVEQKIIQQEADVELLTALYQLPIKYREVIYLYYYEEYSMQEMAELLQLNENTVKSRLRKAKQLLKQALS